MSLSCATCPVRDRAACAVLDEAERDELARVGRTRKLSKGETLFAAGESGAACATLKSGALKITATDIDGRERILSLVHPSGFVGEMFAPYMRHDVVALGESELCVFSGPAFADAIERYPRLAQALLRRTQEDLFASRELLALTGNSSAEQRVAGALLSMARAASDSPCHPATRFDLPLSRGELADMLGLTIETVSRMLTRFERDGAIRREGKRGIELIDPALLPLS
ncbi:Crp/Fnr family transcriptional regulator [Qipengyuania vesicularis]|uniref:Crp/Fnr family transcriptional regulator n=1 Tax=Qipengyuania vesicularis TaxID=2867232 RepID=UPI001C86A208|nr:Crp/Fnr family transcriptional regulator [Qipengyuania vesicularis]MBX7526315.1 Crp/Fnr family transcriptional regulator [Qipengyuania vesicularis]